MGVRWESFKGTVKGTAFVAGLATLVGGALLNDAISAKDKKRFDPRNIPVEPLPPLLTPQDLMLQPAPDMAAGPVEGYGEYQWRNMVNASRGQMLEQPAVAAAAQPRMSAIDPEGVKELGAKVPTV